MKKHFAYSLISVLLLSLIVYSCRKEVEPPGFKEVDDTNIAKHAELWLYRNSPTSKSVGDFVQGKQGVYYKPKWDNAMIEKSDRYQIVEFDINEIGMTSMVMMETHERYKDCLDDIYIQSHTRYIYRIDKETGKERGYLMTVVPDLEYLEDNNFEPLKKNSYLQRDYRLSGLVLFHEINGAFINGWSYKNGKIIGTMQSCSQEFADLYMSEQTKGDGGGGAGGSHCEVFMTPRYGVMCYYTSPEFRPDQLITCQDPRVDGYDVWFLCTGGGGADVGGGAGGGGGVTDVPQEEIVAPRAQSLFRSIDLTKAQWALLENTLNEMMQKCMGWGLYDEIMNDFDGKTFMLRYDPSSPNAKFLPNDGVVMLRSLNSQEDIMHELFHVRQAYGETPETFNGATLNLEIESYYMTLVYKKQMNPSYNPIHDIEVSVAKLIDVLDPHGRLLPTSTIDKYNEVMGDIKATMYKYGEFQGMIYNSNRSLSENFKNITKITEGC